MGCSSPGATHHLACDCLEAELSRELLAAIQARDSYRASAELRVGMRREFEELLGVSDTTAPETFEAGLVRLRALLAAEAKAARLREALRACVVAMKRWSAEEDGLPDTAADAVEEALSAISLRAALARETERAEKAERERDEARASEEWLAFARMREERDALKAERNAALTLAENRGAAYDMTWREVESLRDRLDKEEEERGRQFGLRVQAEAEVERLAGLVEEWLDGNARLGRPKSIADQRFLNGLNAAIRPTFSHWSGTATKPEE